MKENIKNQNYINEIKRKELHSCDLIKVVMMICVILNHSCAIWNSGGWFNQPPAYKSIFFTYLSAWLGSFHIYTFSFISGYLFYYLKFEKKRYFSLKKDLLNRAERLLLPYIIVALFWCIPIHCYYYGFSLLDIFKKYVLAMGPDQLWYLIMLFVLWSGFYIFSEKINKLSKYQAISLLLFMCIWGVVNRTLSVPSVFQITTAIRYFVFYYIGFLFRKRNVKSVYKVPSIIFIVLNLVFYTFYIKTINYNSFYSNGLQLILNLSGVIMIVTIINKLAVNFNFENYIFLCLKKYNFQMYLFHQQLIYFVVSLLNGKTNNIFLFFCSLVISIIGSFMISVLLSREKYIAFLLGAKKRW